MKQQSQMKSQQDSEGTEALSWVRSEPSVGAGRWETRKTHTPPCSSPMFAHMLVCRCSLQGDTLARVGSTCMSSAAERTPVSGGGGVFGSPPMVAQQLQLKVTWCDLTHSHPHLRPEERFSTRFMTIHLN